MRTYFNDSQEAFFFIFDEDTSDRELVKILTEMVETGVSFEDFCEFHDDLYYDERRGSWYHENV